MLLPAITGSGESDLVTARSALVCTVVEAVAVLLPVDGSVVVEAATALLLMMLPLAALALTLTMIVKTAVSPFGTDALEKTMLPVPPAMTESVRAQPLPVVNTADTNVVLVGTASVIVTVCAVPGPLLTKLIV